jgi:EAL domain-containing protein (putative c-di-GMP-specific phosphodiesterase class I)
VIVDAIIQMAHRLGNEVVAEGVETARQLSLLRSAGCDYVQGYLLGRPSRLPVPNPSSTRTGPPCVAQC